MAQGGAARHDFYSDGRYFLSFVLQKGADENEKEKESEPTLQPQRQTGNTHRIINEKKPRESPQLPKEETSESKQPPEEGKRTSDETAQGKERQLSKTQTDVVSTRKPLTSVKRESSSEEDFEPPACNCPGIYIFLFFFFF